MTTEYIISEELATKVCAILINYGENRVANKLCSRPAPSAPTDEQCRICSEAIRKDEREKVLHERKGKV